MYCKHVSISIDTNCVVLITYGTYNHGVPYHEAKYTNAAVANKSTARVDCLTSLHLQMDPLLSAVNVQYRKTAM